MRVETKKKTEERAYSLWEAEGRPEGRALDHWLQAQAETSPKAKPRKKASRARAEPSEAGAKAAGRKTARKKTASRRSRPTKRA